MGRSRRSTVVLLALAALAAVGPPVAAQPAIELSREVRETLLGLQESWNRWLAALYQNDPETADEIVDELLASTRRLGMESLPDLSRAAAVKAIEVGRGGDDGRAAIALETAERLDPGRPETAFARARVAWADGAAVGAARAWVDGWVRLASQPFELRLWLHGLGQLSLAALLLAGGLFVAGLMVVRGPALFGTARRWLEGLLPAPAAVVAAALVLLWPVVLPGGPAWLALYWSVLLWSDARRGQRVVLALLWSIAAAAPLALAAERDRLAVDLSPPARAVEELLQGRLSGSLFSDLGVLPALLPEEPAVTHLLADLHRRLGQWQRARALYREVLTDEPDNAAALIDLGTFHYERGDYGGAASLFLQATEADPQSALAFFNLTQAYSKGYLFTEMRQAMNRARALGDLEVSHWMAETGEGRLPSADGGLKRAGEVRGRLSATWRVPERESVLGRLREIRSLLLALACLVAAGGFHLARRRSRDAAEVGPGVADRLLAAPWRRAALPGLSSLVAGGSWAAYGALLLPALLLLLPRADTLGFEVPITAWAGPVTVVASAAGWLTLAAVRLLLARRQEGR